MAPRSARPWATGRSPIGLSRRSCALRRPLFFQRRPPLLPPGLNGGRVALRRPRHRALHAVPHGMQEPTDVRWMVTDTKRAPDHFGDPLAGPHLAAEPVGFWTPFHERGQLGKLLGAQACLPTGGGMAAQPFAARFAPPLEPLADRAGRHSEGHGDVLLFPALCFQLPGALSPPLAPIELRRFGLHD